jgi:O-antigen/teichoic acid export membrane protein
MCLKAVALSAGSSGVLVRASRLSVDHAGDGLVNTALTSRLLSLGGLALSRGGAILTQFLAQLMVAATAGASGLGVLQLLTSWVCIGGEVLALGLPALAMRRVSVATENGEKELVSEILNRSRRLIFRAWLVLALVTLGPLLWLSQAADSPFWAQYGAVCMGALLLAPAFSLTRLYAESLKSLGSPLTAVTLENLVSPAALLLVSGLCWLRGESLTSATLLLTAAIGLGVTPLVLQLRINRQLATQIPVTATKAWITPQDDYPRSELLHLWGCSVLSIVFLQMPFLLLPLFANVAEIGVFALAHKLINVITALLILLAAVFGPAFARCAARGDNAEISRLLRRTQLLSMALYLPLSFAVIAASDLFGSNLAEDFDGLTLYLLILASGQLVNAATGLAGVMLNMTGAAKCEFYILLGSTAVGLLASLCLGVLYGPLGIACAWSGSVALKNLGSYTLAHKHLSNMEGAR